MLTDISSPETQYQFHSAFKTVFDPGNGKNKLPELPADGESYAMIQNFELSNDGKKLAIFVSRVTVGDDPDISNEEIKSEMSKRFNAAAKIMDEFAPYADVEIEVQLSPLDIP